jgi:hypothetical protein
MRGFSASLAEEANEDLLPMNSRPPGAAVTTKSLRESPN